VTTAAPAPASPPAPEAAPVYVYGIVRSGTFALRGDGVSGRPVTVIERDGLAALASTLGDERLRARRRDLVRHLQILEAAFAKTTVVPCAFGMVLPDAVAVERELLSGRRTELLELLDRLDGRVQLNLRAAYDEDTVLREIVEGDHEIARLRRESRALGEAGHFSSLRLGELVAGALEARRAADERRLLDGLFAAADDVVVDEAGDTLVLKASFLVARSTWRRFDAALEKLAAAEAPRIVFESIGPLPPTAFAALRAAG
jgi:hypothetical protein